ncbi:MAG TPA: tetratricopeptide repeat protein, partial [Anaerolineales bacterium]|nr:tetratricopeptide repeat protein [Anaerolineales bacterium]
MRLRPWMTTLVVLQLTLSACSPKRPGPGPSIGSTLAVSDNATSPVGGSPTATETPVPIVRVTSGDRALFNGDYEAAVTEYESAAAAGTDPSVRAAALWGLARALYADERYQMALDRVRQLAQDFPDSPYAAP